MGSGRASSLRTQDAGLSKNCLFGCNHKWVKILPMRSAYIILFLCCLNFPAAQARLLGESVTAISHSLPGDSDNTSLALPGLQLHEFNDYYGNTDKLITGGGKANVLWLGKNLSVKASFKGSYIQPILKTRNDMPNLEDSIGIHAEELNSSINLSYTHYRSQRSNDMALKFNIGAGYVNLGKHGLVQLYRQIHHALGLAVNDDLFGPRRKENFRYFSYGTTFIFPLAQTINLIMGISVYNSRAFYEYAYEAGLIFSFNKEFAFSFKYQWIDQKRSEWWSLASHRKQIIAGLRFFSYWTPSLMYVSSYVKGDKHGQIYLSPLSFTVNF